jgi:hypothetical protein
MYRLNFYVPEKFLERVKEALFEAGAGRIGDYEKCCWQVPGTGQFLPGEMANPAMGKTGQMEQLSEFKVEMVCSDEVVVSVIDALLQAHPYEEPAYDVVKVLTRKDFE